MSFKKIIFSLVTATLVSTSSSYAQFYATVAPVSGFARSFPLSFAIDNADISVVETGQVFKTDANGRFGPIYHPIGQPITLKMVKLGFKTIQSATVIVPPQGLTGPHGEITFQVPEVDTYDLFASIIGAEIDENSCHVTATIAAYQKTLDDDRQGEVGAVGVLQPAIDVTPFYFDIYEDGPLKDKTNPFTKGLTAVTADGGIAYFNLPPREEPYTITAVKPGVEFTEAKFICRKGEFINLSPPQGPTAKYPAANR